MLVSCETCGTSTAKLELESDKAICTTCKQEVPITSFSKQMMRSNHDVLERSEILIPPNGMLTTCENNKCNRPFSAEVDDKLDTVTCPYCKTEAKISVIAKGMLRSNGILVGTTARYAVEEGKEAISIKENARRTAAGETKPIETNKEDIESIKDIFR